MLKNKQYSCKHTPPLLHGVDNNPVKVGGVLCVVWYNEYAND